MKEKRDVQVGDFLRTIRKAKGITQKEISERAGPGISYSTINGIEMGTRPLNRRKLDLVEKAYDLNPDQKANIRELFHGDVKNVQQNVQQEELDILYRLLQLPEESRKRIMAAVVAYES